MLVRGVKLILQLQRLVVILDSPERASHCACFGLQKYLAFFGSSGRAIPAIMGRMVGVPPDARINARLAQPFLIPAWIAFAIRAQLIAVNQIRADRHDRAGFKFPSMTV